MQSIQSQNYPNTTILQIPAPISFSWTKSCIRSSCPKNSVLLFTSSPLQAGSLKYLNQQFQHYKVWLLYSSNSGQKQIMAVFYRIFQLLGINDFDGSNFGYLQNWDTGVIGTGMMELADKFRMEVDGGRVFLGVAGYFGVDQVSQSRTKYTYILRLSQDYPAKIGFFTRKSVNEEHKNSQTLWIGKTQLQHARDRVQTVYLPKQHSIHKIQRNYFSEKYRIPEEPQEQLPICLTILSHNNIQNRRYIKVIDSILQQEYQNYHIVFFDDHSDDLTMVKTIQYLRQIGFPMNRTKFVQGLKRNFATYNIINSAYNFCGDNEIQLLMDGDDELIGTQVFRLYNSLFVKHPDLWLIYSTFQNNQYDLGWTIITKFQSQIGDGTKRINLGGMSPVRAWRVQLIRSIPLMYHLDSNHEWLDTLYDDALAQCLFQLSGIDRILYMPQLLLDYNTNYGDNDNSSEQKSQHRVAVYKYMHSLPALKQLKQLSNKSKQIEVENILKKDLNDRYRVFDIDDL